jgi:structural maintenance of chromosome 3 (chondroitin sulfate proteoglycan 6)
LQQKEESERKLRELGVLPSDYAQYKGKRLQELIRTLEKTNRKLAKFTNINKKALDQYETFDKQLHELLARQDELDQSSQAIEQLIESLEAKKHEVHVVRVVRVVVRDNGSSAKPYLADFVSLHLWPSLQAIERTFRGVSKEFSDVFRTLVPTGSAKLVLKKSNNEFSSVHIEVGSTLE